jgi:integration host factor subunit alpha
MTLTKADIVNRLQEADLIPKAKTVQAVETLIEIMKKTLEDGDNVLISGFGKFSVKDKKPRRGRNPHTGEDLMLEARRVVTFKPSGVLRNRINKTS